MSSNERPASVPALLAATASVCAVTSSDGGDDAR